MSSFNLAKKLLPAKKAWKSFKTTLKSKFQKLWIKRTKYNCIKISKVRVLLIPPKIFHAPIIRPSPSPWPRRRSRQRHQRYTGKRKTANSSAIYVDDLIFPGHASMHNATESAEMVVPSSSSASINGNIRAKGEKPSTNLEKQLHKITASGVVKILEKKGCETSSADAWRNIPLPPQLRCVDERAEEFISKVRLEMKLEREQSIIDFQEMLARST